MSSRKAGGFWRENRGAIILMAAVGGFLAATQLGIFDAPHRLTGKPAPAFEMSLLQGGSASMAAHKDQDVVVLEFWTLGCVYCREALPVLDRVARDYRDRHVATYAVNIGDPPDRVKAYLESNGLGLRVGLDPDGFLAEEYGVGPIPHTVVVGRDGTVRDVHIGMGGGYEQLLRSSIEGALTATPAG